MEPKNLKPLDRLMAKAIERDPYRSRLELDYSKRLNALERAGLISSWQYEPCNIRLANNTFYKIDWLVIHKDGTREWCETKGYHKNIRESRSKWKIAAERWPWDRWSFVTQVEGHLEVSAYYADDLRFLQLLHASLPPQMQVELRRVVWRKH